jgi:hypothetical protein
VDIVNRSLRLLRKENICQALFTVRGKSAGKDKTKVCAINYPSMRDKWGVVFHYTKDNNHDTVAMTETWLKSDDNRINASGFKLIYFPRQGCRGGIVGLLYKQTIYVSEKIDESAPSLEAFSVYVKTEKTSFRFILTYRIIPGGKGPRRTAFHVDFAKLIDKYVSKAGSLLIAGDLNMHGDNCCPEQRELKDLLESTNLKQ